ncbi:hypothetical protein V5N11_028830 [Cardamine amara subsp. amara]|uniref:Pectinesterase inhibitor domain-containing protein n=1 Tax=Cardamine amara subsp. amara TaxID=228776 RepID=A0ABD1BS36_CARAN
MDFMRCFFFMTTVLVLYIYILQTETFESDGSTEALINSICIENEDYGFCSKIIHENLQKPTATIEELTDLILHTAFDHARDTYGFINNIIRQWHDPKEMMTLETCLAVFDNETTNFLKILGLFSKGEYTCMIRAILTTAKTLENCRTNFIIPPYKENPLIEKFRVMRILITMSGVSGNMVKYGKASLLSSVVTAHVFQ